MMPRILLAIVAAIILIVLSVLYFTGRGGNKGERSRPIDLNSVLGREHPSGYATALTPRRFVFPRDHGPHHRFRNEWWYFTGNLRSTDGRSFGYQLTFFRVALTPHLIERSSRWGTNEVYMAHFALTDVEGRRFRFAERFSRAALGLAGAGGEPLAVWLENWSARESAPRPWSMKLAAEDTEMAIDLDLESLTRVIANGDRGLSRKSPTPGNASYYYSIPRMQTSGTIRSGKETFRVSGLSWLDREWSTSVLESDQVGWDWFALQLQDGRDIMFYRLRKRDGSVDPFSSGTLVEADGRSHHLGRDQVQLEIRDWWRSPTSGVRYPSFWRLRIPSRGIDLEIVPKLRDQELAAGFRYWEGAVAVKGEAGNEGSGYLEMTGY